MKPNIKEEELLEASREANKGPDVDYSEQHLASLPQQPSPSIPKDPVRAKIFEEFSLDKTTLDNHQTEKLIDLLIKYKNVWQVKDKKVQHTDSVECEINLSNETPVRTKLKDRSPVEEYIIGKLVTDMKRRGVIQPSSSPWASPILLVDKKNGKIRFCVDYRRLNKVTIKDAYPLPKMSDILNSMGKSTYFSTLNLTDAFWSIKIKEEDRHKIAFISRSGLWEFISMPFGLTNAPATQQRFIEAVLGGLIRKSCFTYIDDILCFSNTFEEHVDHLDEIMSRLESHNLLLQPAKCSFCKPSFEILGYVATKHGLKPSPKKVQALKDYPEPRSVKEVESFLGMVSWLRRFIPHCSNITRHLRQCTKQEPRYFKLTQKARDEFNEIKRIITDESCLAHPKMDEQFYIHVDCSGMGKGAILTQTDDSGRHRVIEYASQQFDPAQRKYSNTVREAHGILWALQQFQYYVLGRDPIVFCDCKCLSQLFCQESTKPSRKGDGNSRRTQLTLLG